MRYGLLLGAAIVLALSVAAFGATALETADSVIIGSASFAPGQNTVAIPVYFVTHGEITHYNLPLEIESEGNIRFQDRQVAKGLSGWDDNWLGFSNNGRQTSQLGFADLGGENNAGLNTYGRRIEAMTLVISVDPEAEPVEAIIIARVDQRTGGPLFGYSDGIKGVTPVVVNGVLTPGEAAALVEAPLPTEVSLSQNYPNPFNPTTEISFALPDARFVNLTIYNVLGQEVRNLDSGMREAGIHKITWDGRTNSGQSAPSGTYFYRLEAGDYQQSMKMVMLK